MLQFLTSETFNNSIKLTYAKIITVKQLLLNALLTICPFTFITEALLLLKVSLVESTALP